MSSRYDKRGVSADKHEVHAAIKHLDKGVFPNAFCKILPDIAGGDADFCNVMHADTAGTKTSLAYLYWRETGDLSVWPDVVQDAIVMNLDDMACIGCTSDIILSSTIGRNKHRIPGEVVAAIINGTSQFIDNMRDHGVNIILAGGETADVGDIVRTVDIGFTAFARMRRDLVIPNHIQNGDVVVGFASYGKTTYEQHYNGGMGSNGLTSARHDVFSHEYADKYPESFAPETDLSVIYSGSKKLTDSIRIDNQDITLGKLVLSPTRTYLPLLNRILEAHRSNINGLIHNSGGGQTKVIKFLNQQRVIKDHLLDIPPLFRIIHEESGTAWKEMYQVFNMGHRLEAYTDLNTAKALIDMAAEFGIEAQIIGRVEADTANTVQLDTPNGTFLYQE